MFCFFFFIIFFWPPHGVGRGEGQRCQLKIIQILKTMNVARRIKFVQNYWETWLYLAISHHIWDFCQAVWGAKGIWHLYAGVWCFCFPTKMLHLNASIFPLKCSVSHEKVTQMLGYCLLYNFFFKLILAFLWC